MTSDAARRAMAFVQRVTRPGGLASAPVRGTASVPPARPSRSGGRALSAAPLALVLAGLAAAPALAAEPSYPFEGTWVRANRVCAANAPRVRTYTARDVTFATGHCTFRKVVTGGGQFELFEDCRKADNPGSYTETLRMLGPDLMQMRRKAARLKIARPLRYTRCTVAAPGAPGAATPKPAAPAQRRPDDHVANPPEPAEAPKP